MKMANKKALSVLSTAAIGTLIASAVGSTALAKVDGLVVKNAEGTYLNYSLEELKASVINDALGAEGAELYQDFDAARTAGDLVSYHDDKVGFVDAEAVNTAAMDAALEGKDFELDTFTESAEEAVLPAAVYQAKVEDGKVVKGDEVKPTSAATELKVQSVSAVSAKALKVNFNGAVADTSKVSFDVKKGSVNVTLTATWADDKKSVELSRTANLATGDYTVTVSVDGYEFAEGSNVATTKVEAQKVSKIEFVSEELVKNATGTAGTFRYKVYDQYGVDVTKDMAASNFTISGVVGTTSVTPTLTPSTGVGSVTHTFVTTDTKAVITIVNNATGVSATATMNVAAAATVADLQFGEPVLPTNKVNIETGIAAAAKIPVTVTDQYGNKIIDLPTLNSALTLISSSTGVTPTFVVENNVPYISLDTTGLTLKTTVVITAVNSSNGKTFSTTYTVEKPTVAYSIELGDFNKEVIALGDTNVVLGAVIRDQFGNELTAEKIAANAGTINTWFSTSTKLGPIVVETDRNSANYGKLVVKKVGDLNSDGIVDVLNSSILSTGSTEVIAVTPADYKVATKSVVVSRSRVISEVGNINAISLVQGATTNVKLALFDQYQQTIKNDYVAAAHTNADLTYKVSLTKVSGDDSAITSSGTFAALTTTTSVTGLAEQDIKSIPVTAATDKTGVYTLKVQLLNSNSEVVSEGSVTLNIVKNNVEGITYSVADIPTLAGNVDYSVINGANPSDGIAPVNGHSVPVAISAVDANGNTFVVNPADVVNVTSSNTSAVVVEQDATTKKWYVSGNNVTNLTADQRKATLTITINTLDGFKTLTKEVTVSPSAPVIQELRVVSAALGADSRNLTVSHPLLVDKLTYDFATKAVAQTGTAINVIGLDQYGCWSDVTGVSLYVNNKNYADVTAFEINAVDHDSNVATPDVQTLQLDSADAATLTVAQDLLVTLTKDGAAKQITIKVAAN